MAAYLHVYIYAYTIDTCHSRNNFVSDEQKTNRLYYSNPVYATASAVCLPQTYA